MRRILTFGIVILLAVVSGWLYSRQDASATGGAFPYTKHGGGTTDGEIPYDVGNGPGVDRSVNPDYGVLGDYNNQSLEAGKYKGGECPHCHEPHASFGGSEPLPSSGNDLGPDPYLLFKEYGTTANYANLCWYCHENFSNINGSGSPPTMGRYGFYQGKAVYEQSSHYKSPNFYWPSKTGDPVTIWPRQSRASLPSGNKGSCLNCHTPHGIKSTDASNAFDTSSPDGSGGVPAIKQTVGSGNPSVNADYLIPRQLIAWEENLCENCHDASGPSVNNIQDEINKRITGSGHPVDDTNLAGRHVASEALPIITEHVECYDCHNPHAVNSSNRVEGMRYIDISGTVQDPATGARQPYIYEVCFRCHGNSYNQVFANHLPFPDAIQNREGNTGRYSNKRKEFDPSSHQYANYPAGDIGYNTSYHPVVAPGRNGTYALFYQLQNTFGLASPSDLQNLTINCTDCHNNEMTSTMQGPATYSNLRSTDKAPSIVSGNNDFGTAPIGPHGSARNRLLRGNYLTQNSYSGSFWRDWYQNNRLDTNGRPKFELCFICHEESRLLYAGGGSTYGTNFGSNLSPGDFREWDANLHLYHLNSQVVCHDCHHNVHSNVEAQNTIYGNGLGGQLPPDNHDDIIDGKVDTHLINFGPQASGQTAVKPRWYWDGNFFRCNLVCHNYTMSLCYYTHGLGGSTYLWCA